MKRICASILFIALAYVPATAEDHSAAQLAAQMITLRADALVNAGQPGVAAVMHQLAGAVAAGTVTLAEAHDILALQAALQAALPVVQVVSTPVVVSARQPAVHETAVMDVLDGNVVAESASVAVTNTPTGPVSEVMVQESVPQAVTAIEGAPRGEVLAIEPGSDGRSALLAISIGQLQGITEGVRFAIQRDNATLVLARANSVKDEMTIALIIPGTWSSDKIELKVGDTAMAIVSK